MVDLHNHTKLCNHASGEVREYCMRAIEKGMKIYGFSDHAPMTFEPEYRMRFEEMALYEGWVNEAKKDFTNKLELYLGYEVDFGEGFLDDRVLQADVDYFIGSIHFIQGWGFDNPAYLAKYQECDPDTTWREYFSLVEQMANTKLFHIIGHLDLLKVYNFFPHTEMVKLALNALDAIKESGMAIEINTAGLRKPVGELYPSLTLIQEALKKEIPLTLGSDAHAPEHVGVGYEQALGLLHKLGVKKVAYFSKKELKYASIA